MLMTLDGRRVAYDLVGPEGAPVVGMTHSLSADGGMWAEQVPALLGAGFRVLRIDMRGHGGSEPVAGGYTMEALAADVAAVLDRLGIDRIHYVGLSIGGMIGQTFALDFSARLQSAMWCDTLPATPPGAEAVWDARMAAVREAGSLAGIADGTIERWFTPAFASRAPARHAQIRDTIAATTPQGFLGCATAIRAFGFEDRLPGLRVPALVVCGEGDPGTPPEANRRIAALVPGARYEEIADARHLPNVEQPVAFNRIMLGWLASRAA